MISGPIFRSADGQSGIYNLADNDIYYFYSYYSADWIVHAPICIGTSSGSAFAFVMPESIIVDDTTSYIIKYDANGGSGAPENQKIYPDADIVLSQIIPRKSGYRFKGWNTKKDGSGISYDAGTNISVAADISLQPLDDISVTTLYAQWQEESVCAVKTTAGWKFGTPYIKINGKWKFGGHVYIKVNGKWILGTR